MGVSSSLYASISGLNTMGNAMSVLGDNVANVNTIAFKSSRATFQDVLSQSLATASGSSQVGRGVTLSTVDGIFAQGSFESTSTSTDLAIGGQGFFMLRAADSASADMYTRAGEFRFDQEGNLVSPVGHFVQGWTIDSTTEEITGTIGDITIGKSTPPVATTSIDVIVNVDSRKDNETSEVRLFDAWNGTNTSGSNPTDAISTNNYDYTSAIKIYDSKGASHDITIYFDRTTVDNQWEFLVTCEPAEDLRTLSAREQTIYAPATTYDYNVHKGAGALLYGVVDFSTSGDISKVYAWDVPPDAEVDPAQNTNRLVLGTTDNYYSFESNFTGATTDQSINLNFGAQYSGSATSQSQVLTSDAGGFSKLGGAATDAITKETSWSTVYDSAGNQIADGDVFTFTGYRNDGTAKSGRYVVDTTEKVQSLLDQLDSTFACKATIDAAGRLRLTDNTGGDSGMYLTSFTTYSANDADPFASGATTSNTWAISATGATTNGTTVITDTAALLTTIWTGADLIQAGGTPDTLQVSGNRVSDGAAFGPLTFTVGTTGTTIQNFLDYVADAFDNGAIDGTPNGNVSAVLDHAGRIIVIDNTNSGNLAGVTVGFTDNNVPAGVSPWGAFTMGDSQTGGQVNITTSKRQIIANSRGLVSAGSVPPITASTDWTSVYDENGTVVQSGDTFLFAGQKGDSTPVSATFTVGTDYGSSLSAVSNTVNDLVTWLEDQFDADVAVDGAGRIYLTDRIADGTGPYVSNLAISSVTYGGGGAPYAQIFGSSTGSTTFSTIQSDTGEDGSKMGDSISAIFETEALSSTQYANSSTTIFQDQDGFAAGFLQSVAVDTDGVITGNYSNGQVLKKAQVGLAGFNNLAGLRKEGGNIFRETTDSGAPVTGAPGTNGLGSIAPNSLEQSNVDLGAEFVKLITTQRGFQANSKIITTTDEMLADLINIKR